MVEIISVGSGKLISDLFVERELRSVQSCLVSPAGVLFSLSRLEYLGVLPEDNGILNSIRTETVQSG